MFRLHCQIPLTPHQHHYLIQCIILSPLTSERLFNVWAFSAYSRDRALAGDCDADRVHRRVLQPDSDVVKAELQQQHPSSGTAPLEVRIATLPVSIFFLPPPFFFRI